MTAPRKNITRTAPTNTLATGLLLTAMAGGNAALAQTAPPVDPSLEVFRIRCQIDQDIDPATGLTVPKVQIQGKVRADVLDGYPVGIMVENISNTTNPPLPSTVRTSFDLGTASADWDTFPDPGAVTPVAFIPGDFVQADDLIRITAQVEGTNQTVSNIGQCASKTASQFRQDTKNVCTMKKFLLDKCKSGDVLPDGTVMP